MPNAGTGEELVFRQLNASACRTYLVASATTREAVLVDPVLETIQTYLHVLARDQWQLRYVIDTHTHADHISGCAALVDETQALYAMHRRSPARRVSHHLSDGSTLPLGDLIIETIETPGHTKDSVSLLVSGRLLTGDWLFIGGAGRTDLPGGDPGEHWESIQRVIPNLDDSVRICPAHDYQNRSESVLAQEKIHNRHLLIPQRQDYVRWLSSVAQPTPEWMLHTITANTEGTKDPRVNFMPPDAAACMTCQLDAPPQSSIPTMTPEEVLDLLDGAEPPFLLDVRQPEEYVGPLGHLPGALLIPLGELGRRLDELEPQRTRAVVTICRTGNRSATAADILIKAGFEKVFNMTGGTLAWSQKGLPIER